MRPHPGLPGLKVPRGVSRRFNRGCGFRQVSPHALIAPIGHLATAPDAGFRRNVETKADLPLPGQLSQETTGDVLLGPSFVHIGAACPYPLRLAYHPLSEHPLMTRVPDSTALDGLRLAKPLSSCDTKATHAHPRNRFYIHENIRNAQR